jgi:hypothetical protein
VRSRRQRTNLLSTYSSSRFSRFFERPLFRFTRGRSLLRAAPERAKVEHHIDLENTATPGRDGCSNDMLSLYSPEPVPRESPETAARPPKLPVSIGLAWPPVAMPGGRYPSISGPVRTWPTFCSDRGETGSGWLSSAVFATSAVLLRSQSQGRRSIGSGSHSNARAGGRCNPIRGADGPDL